jgi:hypothetical protein
VRFTQPRSLRPEEADVLDLMLSVEFPGITALRAQARCVVVVGGCDCGCPTIDLAVPGYARAAVGLGTGPVPVEGEAVWRGHLEPSQIGLFVADGRLSWMELVFSGVAPKEWPPIDCIRVSRVVD